VLREIPQTGYNVTCMISVNKEIGELRSHNTARDILMRILGRSNPFHSPVSREFNTKVSLSSSAYLPRTRHLTRQTCLPRIANDTTTPPYIRYQEIRPISLRSAAATIYRLALMGMSSAKPSMTAAVPRFCVSRFFRLLRVGTIFVGRQREG
jgi:hypothetical protein